MLLKNLSIALISLLICNKISAQILSSQQIDSLTEKTLSTFNVPGIVDAIIKDGKVIKQEKLKVLSLRLFHR